MQAFKLEPVFKNYIWGGNKLKTEFFKKSPFPKTAESWELCAHKDGEVTAFDGKPLSGILTRKMLGTKCPDGKLPIMIKLIDAADDLSVQVHPANDYAKKHENDFGKTEMWYVISAQKGSGIYCGFNKEVAKHEVEQKILDGSLCEILNFIPCKAGDSFFIPAGTVHAIGKGLIIYEVQQSSNVTYRLFDYNRTDSNKNPRPLHIKKALDVLTPLPYKGVNPKLEYAGSDYSVSLLSQCDYFTTKKLISYKEGSFFVDNTSFCAATVLGGKGTIADISVKKGDTIFISAAFGECYFSKGLKFIISHA